MLVDGKKVKIWQVSESDLASEHENGYLSYINDQLAVAVDGRLLLISQLQLEGKQKMSVKDFRNGAGRNWEGKIAQ